MSDWPTIEYRDFYDVPRAFVVSWHGAVYFFNGPFDDASDEFSPKYEVSELPGRANLTGSWATLGLDGRIVGEIPIATVEFDPTKRDSINPEVFERLRAEGPS